MNSTRLAALLALAVAVWPDGSGLAQTYPTRTVQMIVAYSAGGNGAFVQKENAKYLKVIKETGITAQ